MAYSCHTASNKVVIMEVVMRPLRRHPHIVPSVFAAPPDLIRLWTLRLIVPLGGLQEFINRESCHKELWAGDWACPSGSTRSPMCFRNRRCASI